MTRSREISKRQGPRAPRGREWAFFVVPAALAALAFWRLFEMDLFWALRAGKEIATTGSIPMTEAWSYTVAGTPWLNTHWLTELVLYLVHAAGGFSGLVIFRGLLVASWLSLVALAARRARGEGWVAPWIVAALVFVASTYRMELRAEMFVLIAFSAVVLFWTGRARPGRERDSVLAVLVASNFHAGQGVMVLALALAMIGWTHLRDLKRLFGWSAACIVAFFATPVHVRVVEFIRSHFFYASELTNPDHQPMSAKLFDPVEGGHGLAYFAFFVLFAFSTPVVFRLARPKQPGKPSRTKEGDAKVVSRLSGVYVHWIPTVAVGGVLVWLSIDRVRAVPFAAAFLAPLAARVFPSRLLARPILRVVALLSTLVVAVLHAKLMNRHYGFDVDDRIFPVGAANFVEREKPAKNLHHTFTFGAYIVWALQDYPLFGDTRETPFKSLTALYKQAYGSPVATRALHEKYGVNTLMMPIPGTERMGGVGYRDVLEEYTPRSEWALVYFDDIAIVLLRRIPENARIIAENEYEHIRPNIPPAFFAAIAGKVPDKRAAMLKELERCSRQEKRVAFCVALKELMGS